MISSVDIEDSGNNLTDKQIDIYISNVHTKQLWHIHEAK